MQPTFDMLGLTCPCHHRNDQLSAIWQVYLDTSYLLTAETISNFCGVQWVHIWASQKYWNLPVSQGRFQYFSHSRIPGHPRNTGISPLVRGDFSISPIPSFEKMQGILLDLVNIINLAK